MSNRPIPFSRIYLLLLLIIISFILRFYSLGEKPFWLDEIWVLNAAQRGILQCFLYATPGNSLNSLIIHLSSGFGIEEYVLRTPAVIWAVLSVITLCYLGKITADRDVGLLAAAFLSTCFFHIYQSQDIRPYSLITLLGLLSLLFHSLYLTRVKAIHVIMEGLMFFLGAFVHLVSLFFFFVLICHYILIIILEKISDKKLPFKIRTPDIVLFSVLGTAGFALSIILAGYTKNLEVISGPHGHPVMAFMDMIRIFSGGNILSAFMLSIFIGVAVVADMRQHLSRAILYVLWIFLPFLGLWIFLQQKDKFYAVRYVIGILPIILLAASQGILYTARLVQRSLSEKSSGKILAALIILISLAIYGVPNLKATFLYYDRESKLTLSQDWRGIEEYLGPLIEENDLFVVDPLSILPDAGVYNLSFYLKDHINKGNPVIVPDQVPWIYDIYPPYLSTPPDGLRVLSESLEGVKWPSTTWLLLPLPDIKSTVRSNMEQWWRDEFSPLRFPRKLDDLLSSSEHQTTIFEGMAVVKLRVGNENELRNRLRTIISLVKDKIYPDTEIEMEYRYNF